jgi:hypothetical protein
MPEAMREAGNRNSNQKFDRANGSGIERRIRRLKLVGNVGTQGRNDEDRHAEQNAEKNGVLDECRAFFIFAKRLHGIEQLTHSICLRLIHNFSKRRERMEQLANSLLS